MKVPNPILRDIQSLQLDALVELFVLDMSSFGAGFLYFHSGTNELRQAIVWQGQHYQFYPVSAEGFEVTGQGALPRPTMTVSNLDGGISALVMDYDDLMGAKLTRKRTLARYLDAENFPGGVNPSANPDAGFDDDVWWVNQKKSETRQAVVFELASILDVSGVTLPLRQIIANHCDNTYRSWNGTGFDYTHATCPYTGGAMFNASDAPVTYGGQDVCSGRLSGCLARYGSADLPFAGFPAARRFTS